MNKVHGIVLPDDDTHFASQIHLDPDYPKGVYQIRKWKSCIPRIKHFRHALDVGAHVGLWSRVLAYHFDHVTAFEPCSDYWGLWHENMLEHDKEKYTLRHTALGTRSGVINLKRERENSGTTRIMHNEFYDPQSIPAYIERLDDLHLNDIDFIKIDCEGYEVFAILGAQETILRNKPFILVEQKRGSGAPYGLRDATACDLLKDLGMTFRFHIDGDFGFEFIDE